MGILRIVGPILAALTLAGCSCLPGAKTAGSLDQTAQAKSNSLSNGGQLSGPVVR
ncbi:MAG TPA: hypothetical protein VET25_11915 [Aestuariivirgaceae bacterium]|nr:hypothetical protein [Aestuariivirgaceae bacterium]